MSVVSQTNFPLKRRLIGLAVLVNVLLLAVTLFILSYSREQIVTDVKKRTASLAVLLENRLSETVKRVDVALLAVVDHLEQPGGPAQIYPRAHDAAIEALLEKFRVRLPEVDAIRVSNEQGVVWWGRGVDRQSQATYADRPFFTQHQQAPGKNLIVWSPVFGRVSKTWVIPFTRSFRKPDGSFGGVISAAVPITHFLNILSKIEVGEHGSVVLRSLDHGLIARYPVVPSPVGDVGNKKVSQEFLDVFNSGSQQAHFHTNNAPDGFERTYAFHRLQEMPAVITIGMAPEDYLDEWYAQALIATLGMLSLAVLTTVGVVVVLRIWRAQEKLVEEGVAQRYFLAALLESVPVPIFYKDTTSRYLGCNQAFCTILGRSREEIVGKTVFDLSPPELASHYHEMDEALLRNPGIQEYEWAIPVRDGGKREVRFHKSTFERGDGEVGGIVAAMTDLTEQKLLQRELAESQSRYRQLATQLAVMMEERAHWQREQVSAPPQAPAGLDAGRGWDWSALMARCPGLDFEGALQRFRGNQAKYQQVLQQFGQLHAADGALMVQALAAGDFVALRSVAHALKGGSATLGLVPLQSAAHALELAALHVPPDRVQLEHLQAEVVVCLQSVCEALESLSPSPTDSVGPVPDHLDPVALAHFRSLLAAGDFAASEAFATLRPGLQAALGSEAVEILAGLLAQCDFATALDRLSALSS